MKALGQSNKENKLSVYHQGFFCLPNLYLIAPHFKALIPLKLNILLVL